jgi:transketolase
VGIISTGIMSGRALEASKELAQEGVGAAVLHVPTLKPLDVEAICDLARSVELLVTAENHVVTGGLGTAVADILVARGISQRLIKVGIPDQFIECGSVPSLQAKYGLLSRDIVAKVRAALKPGSD